MKDSGPYLRPKTDIQHTHSQHLSTSTQPLQMIKALSATGWDKHKEPLMATYKVVMRPALEYASSIWSPLASSTSINKLQVMQNAALRTATGCTQDTNIQHLHDETLILPIHEHLQLLVSQYKQKIQPSLTQTYNILQHSKAKKTLSLTTSDTQQTFPQTPTQSPQPHFIHPPHQHGRQPRTITLTRQTHMQH